MAYKSHSLMRGGRSLGIWFIAATQKSTKSEIPVEIMPNQKGRCVTDYGSLQVPYISDEEQLELIKKYILSKKK